MDELRLRKMSDEREKTRIENEIAELRKTIQDRFGVSVEDFEETIGELKKQIDQKVSLLKNKLQEAKNRIGGI